MTTRSTAVFGITMIGIDEIERLLKAGAHLYYVNSDTYWRVMSVKNRANPPKTALPQRTLQ